MTSGPQHETEVRRVLVLYTGGTIGMKKGPQGYEPVPNYMAEALRQHRQFHDPDYDGPAHAAFVSPPSKMGRRVAFDIREYTPLLDSSNIGMQDWSRIAQDVADAYDDYDAFIVLHGTDTMAFTASALSFMLENLAKTVIVTGSQIPISEVRNDGIDNLQGALLIAGHYEIPEVCLYFNNKLMRGNRCVKLDASALDAFHSGNFPPLVELGIDIQVRWPEVLTPPSASQLTLHTKLEPNVGALRLFPGLTKEVVRNFTQPPLRGLVLQTYGAGNAPDGDAGFLAALRAASDRGVVIVNCTQCFRGTVQGHYAAGQRLAEAGVIGGADMTVEAALTKLAHLFGRGLSPDEVKAQVTQSLRGELTLPRHTARFSFRDRAFVRTVAAALTNDQSAVAATLSPVLMCATAGLGDLHQLQELVAGGGDLDGADYDGRTAIHLAASEGHYHVVEFLIASGAQVNVADRWGGTPLRDATRHAHDDVAALLREHGASLDHAELATELCAAATAGDVRTIRRLVENGADPSSGDYDRRTALHLAAVEGQLDVVNMLLSLGADTRATDRWGQTPLDEARSHAREAVARALEAAQGD